MRKSPRANPSASAFAVLAIDSGSRIRLTSPGALELLGLTEADRNAPVSILATKFAAGRLLSRIATILSGSQPFRLRQTIGQHRFEVAGFPCAGFEDVAPGAVLVFRRQGSSGLEPLTGVWDHTRFQQKLAAALAQVHSSSKLAVFLVGVDSFRDSNNSLGRLDGDRMLTAITARLSALLGPKAAIARLGGGEFAFFLDGLSAAGTVNLAAANVLNGFCEPILLDTQPRAVSLSLGAAVAPDDALTAPALIHCADAALSEAKRSGPGAFRRFDDKLEIESRERTQLRSDLAVALAGGELSTAYQPQVDIASGRVRGAECLLRWKRAEERGIGVAKVIAVAEESGLILSIGGWVLSTALGQSAMWRRGGLDLPISVNLSAVQVRQDGLFQTITGLCASHSVPAGGLQVEITESILLSHTAGVRRTLAALRDSGVGIVLDDFGTGYGSLAYLRQFPIDEVKIDSSFTGGIGSSPQDEALVRGIIHLAHSMGIKVVAEGVEQPFQWQFLRDAKCDFAQGFLFSPAVPSSQVRDLATGRPLGATAS